MECGVGFRQPRTCRRTRPGQLCATSRNHALLRCIHVSVEELSTAPIMTDYSFPSDCAAPWSFLMYGFDVAYMFERRHVAGATPNAFLKAREKAASEL